MPFYAQFLTASRANQSWGVVPDYMAYSALLDIIDQISIPVDTEQTYMRRMEMN